MRRGLTVRKLSERKEGETVLNAEEEEGEEVQFKIKQSRVNILLEKDKSPSPRTLPRRYRCSATTPSKL